jgi:hypothetical protein
MSLIKRILAALICLLTSSLVLADTWLNGYVRRDGTYVQGHYRQEPNSTNLDNYSMQGNVNSYNDSLGSRAQDYSPEALDYGSGRTIYTGKTKILENH